MKSTETFRLFDKWLLLLIGKVTPPLTKVFGNLCIVHVGRLFANDATFDLTPHHKRVHGAFDVARTVFLSLKEINKN